MGAARAPAQARLIMLNDAAHVHQFGECDCREAELLRELVRVLDSPDQLLNKLASTLAVWKIRSASHAMSGANDWSTPALPWAKRQEYDTDPRTAEELHADVSASWERWYRARDTAWLIECLQHASGVSTHALMIRRIIRERQ
jgi:hypothetical protein